MPDPKKKKKKISKNPGDIAITLERDYPKHTATYEGTGVGNVPEFRMRSKNNGSTFTIRRGSAFPAVEKERAKMLKKKYRNK
tara:strand:- start:28 stop:273 length:246 start_codon:yes stop_codon:yes gene_type:complete